MYYRHRLLVIALAFSTLHTTVALSEATSSEATPSCSLLQDEGDLISSLGSLVALVPGAPGPTYAAVCNAYQTCPNQCEIQCSGTQNCVVGSTSVTCDGGTITCPYPSCNPGPYCLNPCAYCACVAQRQPCCMKACTGNEGPYCSSLEDL